MDYIHNNIRKFPHAHTTRIPQEDRVTNIHCVSVLAEDTVITCSPRHLPHTVTLLSAVYNLIHPCNKGVIGT